jgi:azobenzene reductase
MSAKILGINGSLRNQANSVKLVEAVLESARRAGAETRMLDLREYSLPLYEAHEGYDDNKVVAEVIELVTWADGCVIGSPEYHGCMSGATKNFLDFLYREIAGKLFGLVAATGGSQGNGCFDNLRAAIQFCHGWTLPYNTSATGKDFGSDGQLINERVMDRLNRMGRDLATYAPLLHLQFRSDIEAPVGAPQGFAKWMA